SAPPAKAGRGPGQFCAGGCMAGEHRQPARCFTERRWSAPTDMCLDERRFVAQCITCGSELHPDRAKKYNYCMAPECQRKNLKGVELVAVGVNKAAEQYLLRDQQTMDELASGKFADQRRGSFGTSLPSASPAPGPGAATRPVPAPRRPGAD